MENINYDLLYTEHFVVPKNKGKKNKGVKHTMRGNNRRLEKKNTIHHPKTPESLEEYLNSVKQQLGDDLIKKETQADFYILCPYHRENTASMGIAKNIIGLCKCWGCGKSVSFSKMIGETLGVPALQPEIILRPKNQNHEDDDLPF